MEDRLYLEYNFTMPRMDQSVPPNQVQPGMFGDLVGVDGRFAGCLRKFYGMKKVLDLDDVTGTSAIDSYEGPSYVEYVVFQKRLTSTVYQGFVICWDANDDTDNQQVDLVYTADNGSTWSTLEIYDYDASGITNTTEIDSAVAGAFLHVAVDGKLPKTIYWDGSALVCVDMGPGAFDEPMAGLIHLSDSPNTDYQLRGNGTFQVAWRFYNSIRGIYSAMSEVKTIHLDHLKTTKANGTISFASGGGDSGMLVDGDTITINSRVYEADDDSSYTGDVRVPIGGLQTSAASIQALADAINGDEDREVTATVQSGGLLLEALERGTIGNQITLAIAEAGPNTDDLSISGSTLSGGGVETTEPEEQCTILMNFPDAGVVWVSSSPSDSPSSSASVSPSGSPSATPSVSSSPSFSVSPSGSPSTSPSFSVSPSTSPSTSPSFSVSPSSSPSVTPSASPSSSPSASPSASPSVGEEWYDFSQLFDTIQVFRSIDLADSITSTGAILYLEKEIAKENNWDTQTRWDALRVNIGAIVDEALPFQTMYDAEKDICVSPPQSGTIGRYGDLTFMAEDEDSGFGYDTYFSSMEHLSSEYFSSYNKRKGDPKDGRPMRYINAGDSMFQLCPNAIVHIYKASGDRPLQFKRLHQKRGLAGKRACHAAGNSVFMLSGTSAIILNATDGGVGQISAVDRLLRTEWKNYLAEVQSGYDALLNASFFLCPTLEEMIVLWHETQTVCTIEGANFECVTSGPEISDQGEERVYFITKTGLVVTPDVYEEGSGTMWGLNSSYTLDGVVTG